MYEPKNSLSPRNHDDPKEQISRIVNSSRHMTEPKYTEQDLEKARHMQILGIGVFIVGLPMFIFSWQIALGMLVIGVLTFNRFAGVEEKIRGEIRAQGIFERQGRLYDHIAHDRGIPTRFSPQVEAIKSIKEIELAKINNQHDAQMREKDHSHEEVITDKTNKTELKKTKVTTEAQVRVAEINANAQVESAKWGAIGAGAEREHEELIIQAARLWEAEERQRERDHTASEADKDRQATIEQMITRFEGKIKEIETRMEYENPNAHKRSQEELITLRGRMAQMREINKIKDPIQRKQMYDQFKKGWS